MTQGSASRLRVLAVEHGGLLVLAVLAFYVWNACPHIVENDQAEFTTLAAAGGVAHAPGYPLHLMWLKAWMWLPASSPAHATSIATAIVAALACGALFNAARAWGASAHAATLAIGLYAFAPLIARYHCLAEVFALNHLVVATVLWLAAERGPLRGHWRAATLGLVAGLGIANHLTCVLVAPVGLLGVWRATRESQRSRVVPLVLALTGLMVGLLPYAYLFIAGESLMGWPEPKTFDDLLDLFLRRAYGGPFSFSSLGAAAPMSDYLADFARSLGDAWAWLLPVVAVLGLALGPAREHAEGAAGRIALAVAFVLAGPLLTARFDLPLDTIGIWITRRFHLLPITLLAVPVALGLDRCAAFVNAHRPLTPRMRRLVGPLIALALVARAVTTLPYIARFQTPAMEREVEAMLRSLPERAIVLGGVNELDVGSRYLQLAKGVRPDVLFVRWEGLVVDWYRAKFVPYGLDFTPLPDEDYKLRLAEHILATGRPLFVGLGHAQHLTPPLGRYPFGIVYRILPRGELPPSVQDVFEINRTLFESIDFDYPLPGPEDDAATWAHDHYADHWRRLGDALLRAGDRERAAIAYELGKRLAPRRGEPATTSAGGPSSP